MSEIEGRSGVDDTLEVRVRAAFAEVAIDDETRKRVLASVYRRARPTGGLQSMRASAVRMAFMLVAMAAILAALFFRGSRLPVDLPIREASAAEILGKALAAVSDSSTVLHVVATTDTSQTPVPAPSFLSSLSALGHPPAMEGNTKRPTLPDPAPTPRRQAVTPIDSTQAEHWIDRTSDRVRSTTVHRTRDVDGRWRTVRLDQLVANGRQQKMHSIDALGMSSPPDFSERSVADTETGIPELGDSGVAEPSLQLRDTSDPQMYLAVLKGRPLNAPPDVNGKPMVTRTSAHLLRSGGIDGLPTYTIRVVSSSYWQISRGSGTDTTLTVTVRASDYLPIRVEGVQRGYETDSAGRKIATPGTTTWTTRFSVMEKVRADQIPDDAFRLTLPKGTVKHSNTPWPAEKIASAVKFPVAWLSPRHEDMRFTGIFRLTENSSEYSGFKNVDNVTIDADENRPKLSSLQASAEYSPRGRPASEEAGQLTANLKVISMPRTDPSTWAHAFEVARREMHGSPKEAQVAWTSVGDHKALRLRHEWRWGNGTPKGRVAMSVEYLAIDFGDSTVMVQGADVPPGVVERAADALTWIR